MDYAEAVEYLYSLGNEVLTAKLGLKNISTLLGFLGNPHRQFASILIAGTNGKGSVAAFCESILKTSGYRTALYTSPHLMRIEERIRVEGAEIPSQEFARLTEEMRNCVTKLLDRSRPSRAAEFQLDRHPTYFEMVTAIAFRYFAEQRVDVAVLEVGLGGRLDATNVVDPLVTVITNVDYDHQRFLGTHLEQIASEKAGIIKPRSVARAVLSPSSPLQKEDERALPVVLATENETVSRIVRYRCERTGARLIRLAEEWDYEATPDFRGYYRVWLKSGWARGAVIDIPLPGEHQVTNALAAVRVIEELQSQGFACSTRNVQEGIRKTSWPGRLEILQTSPRIILDGAHNPAGLRVIVQYVRQFLEPGSLIIVYGAMRDKPAGEMVRMLFPYARHLIVTKPEWDRAMEPREVVASAPELATLVRLSETVPDALGSALQLSKVSDTILVVGSLFLVGDAKKYLQEHLPSWTPLQMRQSMSNSSKTCSSPTQGD